MAEKHKREIGGNTFYIRRYQPFLALEILGDLQQQFAAPLLSMVDGKPGGTQEENSAALMSALGKLSKNVDGKTLRLMAQRLIDPENQGRAGSDYIAIAIGDDDPKKMTFDDTVRAEMTVADILQLCWEIITYNYAEVLARFASPTGPAGGLVRASLSENSARNF